MAQTVWIHKDDGTLQCGLGKEIALEEMLGMMGGEVPWPAEVPLAEMTSVRNTPTLIRELIGRRCRVYNQGDALTMDFVPDRVNIELTERNRIADIWFG